MAIAYANPFICINYRQMCQCMYKSIKPTHIINTGAHYSTSRGKIMVRDFNKARVLAS